MSIESVVLCNHLIFCHPLLLLPSIFPSIPVVGLKGFKHNSVGRVMDTGSTKKLWEGTQEFRPHSYHWGHLQESSLYHQERSSFLIYPKAWRRLWESLGLQGDQTSQPQPIKEINPKYSLEGLILKLKLQDFGHWCKEMTHWKRPWCWERLKAGREGGSREWNVWMPSLT